MPRNDRGDHPHTCAGRLKRGLLVGRRPHTTPRRLSPPDDSRSSRFPVDAKVDTPMVWVWLPKTEGVLVASDDLWPLPGLPSLRRCEGKTLDRGQGAVLRDVYRSAAEL